MKDFWNKIEYALCAWFDRQCDFVKYFVATVVMLILLCIVAGGPITSIVLCCVYGWPWILTLFITLPLSAAICGVAFEAAGLNN